MYFHSEYLYALIISFSKILCVHHDENPIMGAKYITSNDLPKLLCIAARWTIHLYSSSSPSQRALLFWKLVAMSNPLPESSLHLKQIKELIANLQLTSSSPWELMLLYLFQPLLRFSFTTSQISGRKWMNRAPPLQVFSEHIMHCKCYLSTSTIISFVHVLI